MMTVLFLFVCEMREEFISKGQTRSLSSLDFHAQQNAS